MVLKHFWS